MAEETGSSFWDFLSGADWLSGLTNTSVSPWLNLDTNTTQPAFTDPYAYAPPPATAASTSSNPWLSKIGPAVIQSLIPGLVTGGVGAGIQALFPGDPAKVKLSDTRTEEQKAAEATRLGALGTANTELTNLLGGTLSPLQQTAINKIISESRAGQAARGLSGSGSLETGQGAQMEAEAINSYKLGELDKLWGTVSSLSTGYTPQTVSAFTGAPNPWASIASAALLPGTYKGTKEAVESDPVKQLLQSWFI